MIEPIEGPGRTGKAFAKQAADVGKGPILGPLGEKGRARRVEGDGEDSGVSGHEGKLHSDGPRATGCKADTGAPPRELSRVVLAL